MELEIKKVMGAIFGRNIEEIGNDASPDTIQEWDSLKHINLIIALEEEFNIEFEDDEIVKMLSYENIVNITNEHIKN